MTDSGSDFSTVKVGDRLYYMDKEVVIDTVFTVTFYPIHFRCGETPHRIDFTGKENAGGPQVLFYQPVTIVPPPRPRRLVKKTIEVRPYTYGSIIGFTAFDLDRKETHGAFKWLGPVQSIEIEVWED